MFLRENAHVYAHRSGGFISDHLALRIVFFMIFCLIAGQLFGASGCDPSRIRDSNQEAVHEQ